MLRKFCLKTGQDLRQLVRRNTAGYHAYLSAGGAESFVPMKRFVGVTMGFAQDFYLFHLIVIFFSAGKKLEQPGFKQLVRLRRPRKELPPPLA